MFSGIGGFELGILGADPSAKFVFSSENDKFARRIYQKQFGVIPDGDITQIQSADVPGHDILVGGFPCQDISTAGKRKGLCGARSGLFFEIVRIVREKQPELVFIENVKGILSSNAGWDFAKILIELEESGYECEWQILDTAAWLPQRRERVFIIGHLGRSCGCGRKIFPIRQTGKMADRKEPSVYCIDANYYKGAAKQQRTMILCDSGPGRSVQTRTETIPPIRSNTGAGHNNKVICHSTYPRNSKSGNGGSGHLQRNDGLSYCCDAANSIAIESNQRIRRLTPIEVEKLQGFPPGWTAEGIDKNGNIVKISDTQRYKTLGNAVSVPVIEFIFRHILESLNDKRTK